MQQQKAGQAVHLSMAIEIPHLAHPFLWTFDWSGSETGPSAYDGFPPVCSFAVVTKCQIFSTSWIQYRKTLDGEFVRSVLPFGSDINGWDNGWGKNGWVRDGQQV